MAVTIRETGRSRSLTARRNERGGATGADKTITIKLWAYGSDDVGAIETAVQNYLPERSDGMLLDYYDIDVMGDRPTDWEVDAVYTTERLDEGEYEFSFSTAGNSTQTITQAIAYEDYGDPYFDSKGAINLDDDNRAQGVDVGIPQLAITCRARIPGVFLTNAYIQELVALTYTRNDKKFFEYEEGELLFLGTNTTIIPGRSTDMHFEFLYDKKVTGLSIGGIDNIEKPGHDYLWVRHKDVEGTNGIERQVFSVHVDQIHEFGDFDILKVGQPV